MMILLAAVLLPYQQQLVDCVSHAAVELGATNSEPADSVIKAADAVCSDAWETARLTYRGMELALAYSPTARASGVVDDPFETARRDRDLVYAEAFKALAKARSQ